MADSTEIATVLPKELRLGVPPKMPQARSYMFRQQSTLSSIAPTGTITINIPRLQRSYLRKDSYLRFRVNGSLTPPDDYGYLSLDNCGAYGFFERMEVFDYLGSTLLETISGVPQLTSLLLDMGMKELVDGKNGNVAAGLGSDYVYTGYGNRYPGNAANTATYGAGQFQQSGHVMTSCLGGTIVNKFENLGNTTAIPFTREFAIPLPSFLGLLSDKMVPLHNGFTIVLTVSSLKTPFVYCVDSDSTLQVTCNSALPVAISGISVPSKPPATSDTGITLDWSITDVFMNCQILELGPIAESMILSSSQGNPLVVYTKSFRNYVSTIKGSTWPTTGSGSYISMSSQAIVFPYQVVTGQNDVFTVDGVTKTAMTAASVADMTSLLAKIVTAFNDVSYTITSKDDRVVISKSTTFTLSGNAADDLFLPSPPVQGYTAVTTTGQPEFILNMNLNVASLTNVLWGMRSASQLDSLVYPSVSNRTRNFLQRWQFQYGSTTLPQSNGIQSMAAYLPTKFGSLTSSSAVVSNSRKYDFQSREAMESFSELMKSRPVDLKNSRIDYTSYCWDLKFNDNLDKRVITEQLLPLNLNGYFINQTSPVSTGRFACGLNLQLANNKEGQIISGLNTNGMNTSIRGFFHPSYTDFMDTVRVDAWAEYDAFINISPGIATTVSF